MEAMSCDQLTQKKCLPCEGGVEPYTQEQAVAQLEKLEGWELTPDGQRIRKDFTVKNFMAGIDFFNKVAQVAEEGIRGPAGRSPHPGAESCELLGRHVSW